MKKTEEYIKPLVLESIVPNLDEMTKIKEYYNKIRLNGELARKMQNL
jgi:hypothetical protein